MKNTWLLTLSLVTTIALASGCTKPDWIQQTLVTVDVTGTWQSATGGLIKLMLKQEGAKVTESIDVLGSTSGARASGSIEGAVAGDVFQFKQVSGGLAPFQGEFAVSGDEMSGTVMGGPAPARPVPVTLQRVSLSSR